jgi:TIR domain
MILGAMLQDQVFISHAGADTLRATEVAQALERGGLRVSLDRETLEPGDTFLAFMEQALTESDYCLLLWSGAAARREWVQVEWQAALYRTVKEARRFLLVGRLEDHQLPALLAPRLFVDLFPGISPGIDQVIAVCHQDRAAAATTARPVGQPARARLTEDDGGDTIYVTSELFQVTVPVRVLLDAPVGVCVDRLVSDLGLPRQLDHQGIIGLRFRYDLQHGDQRLAKDSSFRTQGIEPGAVVTLITAPVMFAADAPVEGSLSSARFRSSDEPAYADAQRAVAAAVARAGLAF